MPTLPKATPKIKIGKTTVHFSPINVVIGAVVLGTVGAGAYLSWQYYKENGTLNIFGGAKSNPNSSTATSYPDGATSVSTGQTAVNTVKTGASNLPTTVSPSKPIFSPITVQKALVKAIGNIDWSGTLDALRMISTVDQYSAVQKQLIGANGITFTGDSVRKTILTKCFETFGSNPTYRTQLNTEFVRIGLKPPATSGGSWSLSGLGSLEYSKVITIHPTLVRAENGELFKVNTNNILGREISRDTSKNISTIKTLNGDNILVDTLSIKPIAD